MSAAPETNAPSTAVEAAPATQPDAERDTQITALNEKIADGTASSAELAEHAKLIAAKKGEQQLPDAITAIQNGNATKEQRAVYEAWQVEKQMQELDALKARETGGETLNDDEKKRMAELRGELGEEDPKALTAEEEFKAVVEKMDLDDQESVGETLKKIAELQQKHGALQLDESMKKDFATAVGEWAKRHKNMEGLTQSERNELQQVQECLGEMQRDILDIMGGRKRVDQMIRQQERAIQEIKTLERQVPEIVEEGDEEAQKKASLLTFKYQRLALQNANINATGRAALVAQENFRLNKERVRLMLGITGFIEGNVNVFAARIKNVMRRANRRFNPFKAKARPLTINK